MGICKKFAFEWFLSAYCMKITYINLLPCWHDIHIFIFWLVLLVYVWKWIGSSGLLSLTSHCSFMCYSCTHKLVIRLEYNSIRSLTVLSKYLIESAHCTVRFIHGDGHVERFNFNVWWHDSCRSNYLANFLDVWGRSACLSNKI